MQLKFLKSAAVATAVAAGIAGGYVARARGAPTSPGAGNTDGSTSTARGASAPAPAALPDFTDIVQRYGPAVVNVSTTGATHTSAEASPFGQLDPDDPMYRFFKHFGAPEQHRGTPTRALGSGFIVKSDGVILTNAHVVDGATEVKVKLTDRREYPAKVVGVDKQTDVAVLKIDAKGLPVVKVGDPTHMRVGEWVLAIGSPFGFENSATAGIVSARGRSLPGEGYVPFIQTDVAVNPGNSGGPLFDSSGEVIGINSQIYSRSGGYMGVSFAIPIDVAMNVEQQLVAHGKVTRGKLGVTVQDVTQQLAESFGLSKPNGALVNSVEKGSPAAKAGLEPGDVILSLNGNEVTSSSDLPPRVADLKPGSGAKLEVWRDGRRRDLEVRVGGNAEVVASEGGHHEAEGGRLGLAVRPLSPEERKQAGVSGGVLVQDVQGPAARAGIEPGDVILAVNGTRIDGVDQLRQAVSKSGKHVALLVERGDAQLFVPVDLA
jgi:serine protease Do